ncbi:MAG: SpaH/EbpB family LPXTG-anchored major pilin, partial [Aristaeellaceae bacterium]
ADIGQTVNFKSTITAQAGAENYVFHDTMSAGLTFDGTVTITLGETTVEAANYELVTTGLTDGCTFEVRFTQAFCDTLKANDQIVISYSATLNENAVIAGEGNPNTSKVSYGDSNNIKYTPDSQTKTYTWDVDVFKYTKNGETETALAGATFTLSKIADGSNPIALVSEGNNVYRVAKTGETGTVTEITTDTTGKFTIKGLDSDTYYLTETAAPAGYNKLAGPVTIVINNEGKTLVDNTVVEEVKVLNQTGTELPSTGGIGTTVFYVVGGLLVVGAFILLVSKRRVGAEK